MALEGCPNCLKYLMFAFNGIIWILGCVLLAVGIWAKVDPKSLLDMGDKTESKEITEFLNKIISSSNTNIGANILITFGAIILIIGFLGCCGAIKENRLFLILYFIALLIIFIVLVVTGIFVGLNGKEVEKIIGEELEKEIKKSNDDKKLTVVMATVQTQLKCCGNKQGISDYNKPEIGNCDDQYKNNPCMKQLVTKVNSVQNTLVGVAVAIAIVLILGMICSLVLCCSIN